MCGRERHAAYRSNKLQRKTYVTVQKHIKVTMIITQLSRETENASKGTGLKLRGTSQAACINLFMCASTSVQSGRMVAARYMH